MTNSGKSCVDCGDPAGNVLKCRKINGTCGNSYRDTQEKSVPSDIRQSNMYNTFQNWAIQNYGDRGKTKTVTRNKYKRIVRILKGEEEFTAENSKFRFWVKAKGFQLSSDEGEYGSDVLLVPSRFGSDECSQPCPAFKRVAVVESFFDIIYNVHVEMDGRGGKHAGQKRTYRAIAEMFSFLPREAVTRFLMSCIDCQKRMHLSVEFNNNLSLTEDQSDLTQDNCVLFEPCQDVDEAVTPTQASIIDLSESKKTPTSDLGDSSNESESSDSAMSRDGSPSSREDMEPMEEGMRRECNGMLKNNIISCCKNNNNNITEPTVEEIHDMTSAKRSSSHAMDTENRSKVSSPEVAHSRKASPIPGKVSVGKGHPERKRRASSESDDSAVTKTSEGKGEDDEDDNEDDEKISSGHNSDPERLKAFNMFVRLFVDENLDRMVPISKQPKDKIQAILEACDRQFPEFNERSRKRIRTYLKSCRRLRRSKEHNGWEPLRPTPPHLTSAAAENLLATACENESQNAKRMRLGLEPLPASAMVSHNSDVTSPTTPITQPPVQPQPQSTVTHISSQPNRTSSPRPVNCSSDFIRHQSHPPTFRPAQELTSSFFTNGHGTGLFRPGFPNYQHPAHQHPPVLSRAPITANTTTNGDYGPTDLSIKKSSSKGQLSPTEVTAIKQLIAGYRESAAFLYRSADELEQLLLQQN